MIPRLLPLRRFARSMQGLGEKVHQGRPRPTVQQRAAAVPSGPCPPGCKLCDHDPAEGFTGALAGAGSPVACHRGTTRAEDGTAQPLVRAGRRRRLQVGACRSRSTVPAAASSGMAGRCIGGGDLLCGRPFPSAGWGRRRRCSRLPPATHHSHGRSCPPQTHTALVPAAGPHHPDTCVGGPVPWRQGLGECRLESRRQCPAEQHRPAHMPNNCVEATALASPLPSLFLLCFRWLWTPAPRTTGASHMLPTW